MIKYSDMLKEVINLYPKEIPCSDVEPLGKDGKEGMYWMSLIHIHDEIDEEHNYFQEENELLTVLLWSFLIGIRTGFRNKYVENNKLCQKVFVLDVIDLDETKKQFIENIKEEKYWQDYLKKTNKRILFDDITKKELKNCYVKIDHD